MTDPKDQAATQLCNITEASGMSIADFTAAIVEAGLTKHGKIVAHLKAEHGLTHGNANLMARTVREELAGGPAGDDELLAAQYDGAKAQLRPIYDELVAMAQGLGSDVNVVIQKTGVSFRRGKQVAVVQAPSSKRVQLGLNLEDTPDDARIKAVTGICSHRVDITHPDEIDDSVASWLTASYQRAE